MANHISARLAWHMDGWNGHICLDPAANTYCVGCHSYPGELIREQRDLEWEQERAGANVAGLETVPPCIYSVNAFGSTELTAFADPPEWFGGGASRREWQLPPATVCIWPYEEMYEAGRPDVKNAEGRFDYDKRLEYARQYFKKIEPERSLIFYYANYSNPFSEEEQQRYVVVGVSRVKKVGDIEYFENCSQDIKTKYAGGFVWQMNVTSRYPDEGLRIPYHRYLHHPEAVERLLFVPDNPRNFKYGTRAFSDDEALNLVERFLEVCGTLQELGDTSENWEVRIQWLQTLIAELWKNRGPYPGMAHVLEYLGFNEAIPYWKQRAVPEQEQGCLKALFDFIAGERDSLPGLVLADDRKRKVQREWLLRERGEQRLLRDLLPRFDIPIEQLRRILPVERAEYGITASLSEIAANPYILSEQFAGDGPDDILPFYRIDHGVFPSPDLGIHFLADPNDWRRLRGLCVQELKRETRHTFQPASQLIHSINHRLSFLPEWKRHQFTEQYFVADEEDLKGALTFRETDGKRYIYLKSVYDAERVIERQMRQLAGRPNIQLTRPIPVERWVNYLYDADSILAERNPEEYDQAIRAQAEVCQRIFNRPLSVLSGAAGTGKTTVIKAIIQAIEYADGAGASFCLLAPTGKATDRIRSASGKDAATIHSFLARHGWLNKNMTFKQSGGQQEDGYRTYIIDEASMLDLELMAALFRSIKWPSVKRLILIGDQSQLPPIGRGRVFADIMDWLQGQGEDGVALLKTNIRQMANRLAGLGTGILEIASIYERTRGGADLEDPHKERREQILQRLQEGGDLYPDLRVAYWTGAADLADQLTQLVVQDMERDTGLTYNPQRPFELWKAAFGGEGDRKRADYQQVITPYRGEPFGTEQLNLVLQKLANRPILERVRSLEGVTLFDKVIQTVNRPKSNPVWAWNCTTRRNEAIEVFNGEIGFIDPHLTDWKKNSHGRVPWTQPWFRLQKCQVLFDRKTEHRVGVDSAAFVRENLELAYAISTHKAQGSEFERVYFVVPKHKTALLSREMFYTGITRAKRHCTILVEEDLSPLLRMLRPENSSIIGINASLFEFRPIADALLTRRDWYVEGKIHSTLAEVMVRSKSEVIIVNMLHDREIPFLYEVLLFAPDGTFYLPDFTITWNGENYYWEHLGRLDSEAYRNHWETKQAWYEKHFPGRLVTTEESSTLSLDAQRIIEDSFSR